MFKKNNKVKVLLEMRPAFEGFAGIPQEVRLLFRGLRKIDSVEVEGMLQTSRRRLARGTINKENFFSRRLSSARRFARYSNVIISLIEKPQRNLLDSLTEYFSQRAELLALQLSLLVGFGSIKLSSFKSQSFEDFTWRTLFSKTLPASDFKLVATANHKICSISWHTLHMVGLGTLTWRLSSKAKYPKIDTSGFDIFIGQTPYPGRVTGRTQLIIRYHDAIPIFMPHTISDKSIHQATHFYALLDNVDQRAWFACVSEATRQDLIRVFPAAENRSVTIHNMVSHHYFNENSSPALVPGIIRARLYGNDPVGKYDGDQHLIGLEPNFLTLREQENFYAKHLTCKPLKYLLIVSTIEPRKNHSRLLAAWEVIKADIDRDLKLVIVGTLGWDYKQIFGGFKSWIDRGEIFMLNAVPAPDLRVLYKHAAATVCPSVGEGFDFSGVESMACGGITVASDIAVHVEIYDDAAEYFDPYSTLSLVTALKKVLYDETSQVRQVQLREKGKEVSARYLPEKILPQWKQFLGRVVGVKSLENFQEQTHSTSNF